MSGEDPPVDPGREAEVVGVDHQTGVGTLPDPAHYAARVRRSSFSSHAL